MADDPYVLLAGKINVDPAVLRAKFEELGLSLSNDAAHVEWERRARTATLAYDENLDFHRVLSGGADHAA